MTSRIFFDASALFAAVYSPTGAARELLRLGLDGSVKLVTNQIAIEEAERNLARKAPEGVTIIRALLAALPIEVLAPQARTKSRPYCHLLWLKTHQSWPARWLAEPTTWLLLTGNTSLVLTSLAFRRAWSLPHRGISLIASPPRAMRLLWCITYSSLAFPEGATHFRKCDAPGYDRNQEPESTGATGRKPRLLMA